MKRVHTTILSSLGLSLVTACGTAMPPSGDVVIGFTASNPTHAARPEEFVHLALDLATEALAGTEGKTPLVFQIINGQDAEVPSQVLEWEAAGQEGGAAVHLEMVFRDAFGPGETKSYELRFAEESAHALEPMEVKDLGIEGVGDRFSVKAGAYTFMIGHELERLDYGWGGALMKDLYVRLEGAEQWARLMPLSHIYFNTPEHRMEWLQQQECEPLFVISFGVPPDVTIQTGALLTSIALRYRGQTQQACPPYEEGLEPPLESDLYTAEVVLTFYRDLPRVDTRTNVVLRQGFYNHNGFALGGVETQLARPRVLFGVPEHTVLQGALWADTNDTTDRTEFMQVESGQLVFRRARTRDAGAPFEVLSRSDTFNDYYVVEGLNGSGAMLYFPDFERLAYQNTRNEGVETVPVNMVAAGPSVPLMVPNALILSQTHLGDVGEAWAPIAPGTYSYRLTGVLDVAFDPEAGAAYDEVAEALAMPIAIRLAESALPAAVTTASPTIPPPASSTPPPTATQTLTPSPASCDPPELHLQARPLPEGSLLPLLENARSHFEDDGALMLDNRGRSDYAQPQTEFFSVPGPFRLAVAFESEGGDFVWLDGKALEPREWWDGEALYHSGDAVSLYDGRSANPDWHFLQQKNDGAVLEFHFYEPCGKRIGVSDSKATGLLYLSLEHPGQFTDFDNGLFPDWVVAFGLQVDPGSWIRVTELTIAFD